MTDSNKHYTIIENWVREFINTMDDGPLREGNDSGKTPFGIKIIFDGYGEDDEGNPDTNNMSFAVFIHKNSLTEKFKEHETAVFALIHRPSEECYINCWYDASDDSFDVTTYIEDEQDECTELDRKFIIDLIHKIDDRDDDANPLAGI